MSTTTYTVSPDTARLLAHRAYERDAARRARLSSIAGFIAGLTKLAAVGCMLVALAGVSERLIGAGQDATAGPIQAWIAATVDRVAAPLTDGLAERSAIYDELAHEAG